MLDWIKKHISSVITGLIVFGVLLFIYACDSQVQSMYDNNRRINRQELQLELDQFMAMVQIRMVDLDKQDELRAVILQNALILVQGQPVNVLGLITGAASIYGLTTVGRNVGGAVKKVRDKKKAGNSNNG